MDNSESVPIDQANTADVEEKQITAETSVQIDKPEVDNEKMDESTSEVSKEVEKEPEVEEPKVEEAPEDQVADIVAEREIPMEDVPPPPSTPPPSPRNSFVVEPEKLSTMTTFEKLAFEYSSPPSKSSTSSSEPTQTEVPEVPEEVPIPPQTEEEKPTTSEIPTPTIEPVTGTEPQILDLPPQKPIPEFKKAGAEEEKPTTSDIPPSTIEPVTSTEPQVLDLPPQKPIPEFKKAGTEAPNPPAQAYEANFRKRAYSDLRDTEELGVRRSTREHKRPKFDDEFVYDTLVTPPKHRGSVGPVGPSNAEKSSETGQKEGGIDKIGDSDEATSSTNIDKIPPKNTPTSHHMLRNRAPLPPNIPNVSNQEERQETVEEREKRLRIPSKDSMLKEIIHGQDLVAESASDILHLWPAVDDVALITAVSHVANIETVFECVQFTREYDLAEVQERWYRLLYDEKLARSSKKRIQELTLEQILFIQARTPFLKREEECLKRGVEEVAKSAPELADFASILKQYRPQFHSARTPQVLSDHYRRMKLCRMALYKPPDWERIETATNLTNDYSFDFQRPLRCVQTRQRVVMDKPALVNPLIGFGQEKLPNNAIAVLKGRFIRYTVTSDHVLIGRSTLREKVDVDLSIEGPAIKVSRKQALLEYIKNERKFNLKNVGMRPIFVDGKPVPTQMSVVLKEQSIIEISALRLVFKITAPTEMSPRMKQALQYLKTNQKQQKLHIPTMLQQQQQQQQQRTGKHEPTVIEKQKMMQMQRSQEEALRRLKIQSLRANPVFQQKLAGMSGETMNNQ